MSEGKDMSPSSHDETRREAQRLRMTRRPLGASGRIAKAFLESKLTPLLVLFSLLLGAFAVLVTPREEEPQIQVPMIDVFVALPGASAQEVERRVVAPVEKVLSEIPNVEYVYSTSQPSGGMIIARFRVGSDPDQAVVRVHAKLAELTPALPPGTLPPVVAPRSIDDVPVLAYTLWSQEATPLELRQIAEELKVALTRHPQVAQVSVLGGQRRALRVVFDRERLSAHHVSLLQAYQALSGLNWRLPAGSFAAANTETQVEVGGFFRTADEVSRAVVAVYGGRPVYLNEVAEVMDGADEAVEYAWMVGGAAAEGAVATADAPAVTVAVAKKPGSNAVELVRNLDRRIETLRGPVIPANVVITKTRDYGFTANEKSSELIFHMGLATLSVVLLMALALGRREAVVVAVAVPMTLALTLASSYLFGYTLNRVTLFALIFAIGILVDDAIVVVENIHRHYKLAWGHPRITTFDAVDEVGNPTILATFTVIAALLPLAFVSGLMGPYMRPIPINASAAMLFSLAVAFVVSPWLTYRLFRRKAQAAAAAGGEKARPDEETPEEERLRGWYASFLTPFLARPWRRWALLGLVGGLLLASVALLLFGVVTVKMLPYDNKSELQVVVDMPEGTTLEATAAAARELAGAIRELPEVHHIQVYAGTSAPFNFNGLVRHYFLRSGPLVADLQVNLVGKHERRTASHAFAMVVRERLAPVARRHGANVKVTEVPPGPPVLATVVAEIYGPDAGERLRLAAQVREIFESTDGVVDVDWYVEDPGPRVDLEVDREKAARLDITPEMVARTVRVALAGAEVGLLHDELSRTAVPVVLRLDRAQRASLDGLLALTLHSQTGALVPLRELARPVAAEQERFIYHKNLQPVTYVVAEMAGGAEAPVYGILAMQERVAALATRDGRPVEVLATHLPEDSSTYAIKWDGEWHITYEVFRDMGVAFAAVLVLIYFLVVGWFRSFVTPLIIMAPIPLTLVGILPAHGLGGVFFTATSMIGFIALAGIIVRNSILLVDFINLELAAGERLEAAVIKAGAVRFRPIALTAAALVVGGVVILLDPIFQGLAVALISGVVAATALTLVVIPLLYYMYVTTVGVQRVVGRGDAES